MKIQTLREYTNPDMIASIVVLKVDQFCKIFYSTGIHDIRSIMSLCSVLCWICVRTKQTSITTRKSTLINVCTFGQHATLPGLTVWCNNWKCR